MAFERRPEPGSDGFRGPVLTADKAAAIRRMGGECDHCHVPSEARRAITVTTDTEGRQVAVCGDCRTLLRFARIAAKIHRTA